MRCFNDSPTDLSINSLMMRFLIALPRFKLLRSIETKNAAWSIPQCTTLKWLSPNGRRW